MRKKTNIILSSILFGFAFIMIISGLIMSNNDSKTKFQGDVYINGENIGGYTVEQASEKVEKRINQEMENMQIRIIYKDKVWQFGGDDFDSTEAVQKVVNTAFKANKISKRDSINYIAAQKGSFSIALTDVFKNFNLKLNQIIAEIESDPIDASVEFQPDESPMFKINDAKEGVKVQRERLINDLSNQFLKTKDITIYVHTESVEPKIKNSYFDDKLNLQSCFSTSIKNSQAGRRNNVTVALDKINGTVVKPGEIVSFNALTGPQDASGGYQNAIIIMNGKYENGIGGGLCQASTTLYNACVLANLEIEEVHKHTIPVHYVEKSLDAMVSDGYADFIFKNNSDNDIYIKSKVIGDDAKVEIYGKSIPDGITIKRVAEVVKTLPHQGDKIIIDENGEYSDKVLYKGEYYRCSWPQEGTEAKAYKEFYRDGQLIKREEIRHEKYLPQQGVVVEGNQDLPEGFVLPEQDVTIIQPQAGS